MRTIEEKAKRYDEIIEKANKMHSENCEACQMCIEELIPELKESEDEKIKKDIITYLSTVEDKELIPYESWIAWLEKQCTQILANSAKTCMDEQKPVDFSDLRTWKYIVDAVWTEKEGIGQYLDSPFTEEVAKKLQKRFGKIEQKPAETEKGVKGNFREIPFSEQKPAWSEEDKNRINRLIAYFEDKESFTAEDDVVYANWLKSLKDRYTWKPSKEQMERLKGTIDSLPHQEVLYSLYQDLKKLIEE